MDAIAAAFDRIDDFIAVQRAANGGITVDAVELLQCAAGVDDERRVMIAQRAERLDAEAAPLLLGVLIGIFAADGG